MFLIKVDHDNYINIDNIIRVTIDKDDDIMYVITSDDDNYEVMPECIPVIQRWIDAANERINEEPLTIKNKWNEGIEPLCVKGVWSKGKEPIEQEGKKNG